MRGFFVAILFVAGCGGTNNDATPASDDGGTTGTDSSVGPNSPLPCEIDDVLARNCRTCHGATPKFGAPMSLVSWEDLQAPAPSDSSKTVWQEASRRVHLPDTDPARMPQKPNPALSAADLATFDAWVSGGASKKTMDCASPPPPDASGFETPVSKPLSCTPDVNFAPKAPWAMPKDTKDIYVCYGVDYSPAMKRHITGVHPRIGNDKIVHHMLLMTSDTAVDPTPHECGSIAQYRMLYGWAPGVGDFELPDVAGLPAEPSKTHFVVQIHYNNIKALSGETDTSGFDVCTTDKLRPNDADVLALGSLKFSIPPKASLDITATFNVPSLVGTIHAIGAFPHMHKLGKSISTNLYVGGAGAPVSLGQDPAYDFNNQFFQPLTDTVIKAGDRIETRCIWQNDTADTVKWGEYTEDEMCYSFTMYYPRINAVGGAWSWQLPAYVSTTTVNK